jgi:hypothetical protein
MLQDIADTADALTEPHQHLEPIWDYDQHRNKRMRRVFATVQPGLIRALVEAVTPATKPDGDVRPAGYRSAPPLCLEAVSRLAVIQIGVVGWCWSLKVDIRDTTESSLRGLVGAAPTMDSDTQATFLDELRQWRTWCAVMTGWQSPAYSPAVTCPVDQCGKPNTIRINLTRKTGMCTACHATWDEDTIGILADYIRTTTSKETAA